MEKTVTLNGHIYRLKPEEFDYEKIVYNHISGLTIGCSCCNPPKYIYKFCNGKWWDLTRKDIIERIKRRLAWLAPDGSHAWIVHPLKGYGIKLYRHPCKPFIYTTSQNRLKPEPMPKQVEDDLLKWQVALVKRVAVYDRDGYSINTGVRATTCPYCHKVLKGFMFQLNPETPHIKWANPCPHYMKVKSILYGDHAIFKRRVGR